ncbi:DUF4623 domain-containing protein [Bacteroides coprosuis]|uniref:DUF4623 domain-containing protein n=1 Tax=Bacteroides coprosuis TaxID=151276 RepID=UPI001D2123AF|nr:DUF4623 domain-containing protein [Bacteroides coprosuis]HJD91711.1 DUF4623 domain-containing protein [Bacteroides coprosuis]
MKKYIKHMGLIIAPLLFTIYSCSSSDNEMNTVKYKTVIEEISITNGGIDGNTEIKGKIDENKKTIAFPRLDPKTDLSAIKFKATLSSGALLDKETYNFTLKEGETEDTQVIKVLNDTRYREYFATIRIIAPVFGGDFNKAKLFENCVSGKNVYPHFSAGSTRGTDFNEKYALIVSRHGGINPHLLKTEDILANKLDNPIMLNTEGISGGTFPISAGRVFQDKVYITNMAGNIIKVYYWSTPQAKPEVIFEKDISEAGEGGRFGDSMDMYIDKDGNGYIFFENNASNKIRRIKVSNFKNIGGIDIIYPKGSSGEAGGQYFSFTKVEGTPYYIYTGFDAALMLVDEGGNLVTKVTAVSKRINQARVINFNQKRYLVGVTAARYSADSAQSVYVYDITNGETITDALELLNANEYKPVFEKAFGADATTSPGTNCGAAVVNNKLCIFGAADAQGFILVEVPIAEPEEEDF